MCFKKFYSTHHAEAYYFLVLLEALKENKNQLTENEKGNKRKIKSYLISLEIMATCAESTVRSVIWKLLLRRNLRTF